ncbi:MAG TPA: ubiquinol oxidase subunit II [Candidatus Saccharimonadales bacterium]|nr:ubiquinol oxidase subunit II [Candidatus Saccharimonadales bacterium]
MSSSREPFLHKLLRHPIALSLGLFALIVVAVTVWFIGTQDISILRPSGEIGIKERNLMVFTVALGALVIIPVFIMAVLFAWRYRESNVKAAYRPDWDTHRGAEATWWGIPVAIILVLAVVTWISTYRLDPFKQIEGAKPPMTIQVVSLDWKWLFIYPDQHIASVNYVQFPAGTPVDFEITSDAPMNSFWIPELGGQMYSMPGMSTHLNVLTDKIGDYAGSSANISGKGFAGMTFTAHASSSDDFMKWVKNTQQAGNDLSLKAYEQLAKPSSDNPIAVYGSVDNHLYDTIVMKYMMPSSHDAHHMEGM